MRRNDSSEGAHMSVFTGVPLVATMEATATSTSQLETLTADDTDNTANTDTIDNADNVNRVPVLTLADKQKTALMSVLLVDDHALMREGLHQLLDLEEDIRVVGEAVDGFDALQQMRRSCPDVVLMDIHMPMLDGIAVTRQISHEFPAVAVIILTMFRDQQQMLSAMKNGAKGYLLKNASSQEVAQAIRIAQSGGIYIEPGMTGAIVHEFRRLSRANTSGKSLDALSEKEVEILRYVATGMSNKEIAEQLSYSEKTVKNYLSVIFQKLGIRDRTQAAIFALRQGILPEEAM